ncbi:hypothetical protein [Ammoniphilus sp. CFH 90114]|uniref:hypothetical protein n=1 Tax=Ammoniphilus sp. CFH 90114 TaxID=2493665 RepID=UPI00100E9A78|nr:hypothetical protein [Ammoniphilus sp. CFH 90114]RXT07274.1 hypothetical protein EIZ39_14140 [Ammoniphilus sp. CFH 90114]
MRYKYSVLAFLITVLALTGCGTTEESLELKMTNMNTSVGLFEHDPNYQKYTYEVRVENVSSVPVEVDYAELVILNDVKVRMKESNLRLTVDGMMEKDDFITLKGAFLFKADDLTKEEITSLKIIEGVMMYKKNGETYFVKTNF